MPRIPFPRATPADVAGCEGAEINTISRKPLPYCSITCERYGHNGSSWIAPALTLKDGEASCPNWSPLISADQIAATDDMAGLHGAATVPRLQTAQVSRESQSVVADSTRVGEGGNRG